jgi:hypothetical protein
LEGCHLPDDFNPIYSLEKLRVGLHLLHAELLLGVHVDALVAAQADGRLAAQSNALVASQAVGRLTA